MDLRKLYYLICCLLLNIPVIYAQDQKVADSLSIIYHQHTDTTASNERFKLLVDLSFNETRDLKKGLQYADELIKLANQAGNNNFLRSGYFLKGTKKRLMGDLDEALDAYFKSAEIASRLQNVTGEGETYGAIADIYTIAKNYPNAIDYYNKAITNLRQLKRDSISLASVLLNIGDTYLKVKAYDSALLYLDEAKIIFEKKDNMTGKAYSLGNIGMVYADVNKNYLAEQNINEAINILETTQDYYPICVYLIAMADLYINKGDKTSALNYTQRSLQLAEKYKLNEQIADASLKLSKLYEEAGNQTLAYHFYKKHITYRDSINNINTVQKMADLRLNHEISEKQIEVNMLNQQKRNERNLTIALGFILALTLLLLGILYKNFQNKREAYSVLDLQKKETDAQKVMVEHTLAELQLTQKQLIQTAKLASLGELTVGVAHEIQNPLNFVTNFSDVGVEMLHDLRAATVNKLKAADKHEANEIINDLADTLKKINNHGKRADSIVKGMLQHSMASSGKKELTNINILADEYLRLGINGLRAKEKDLKVNLNRDFEQGIDNIELVPQDIGRVLLNLYNNAFYSVKEKKSQTNNVYEPEITVTTKRVNRNVEVSVKDNGNGIPQKVLDKIFQPFFTTKPSGQGTGLGLSLSYDIVKAHGGEFRVETQEGEFAEFIIQLPASNDNIA